MATSKTVSNKAEQYGDLIEAKLSRSEVIDLVLEDMIADLENQRKLLLQEINELDQIPVPLEDLVAAGVKFLVTFYSHRDTTTDVMARNIELSKLPSVKARLEKQKALREKSSQIDCTIVKLRSKGARNALLKQLLNASPEGRELIEKLDLFKSKAKVALDAKLAGAALLNGKL